jgi:hypothetical protein
MLAQILTPSTQAVPKQTTKNVWTTDLGTPFSLHYLLQVMLLFAWHLVICLLLLKDHACTNASYSQTLRMQDIMALHNSLGNMCAHIGAKD